MVNEQYNALEQAVREGDTAAGVAEATRLAEQGAHPVQIFSECIEPVLADIGYKFSRLEIFLPEMMESAEVVKGIQEALRPYLEADGSMRASKGRVVICTISGDLHDIGKNIVRAMLEVNGFEVKDLGVDISPAAAVNAAKEFDADIIAFSALMLPSLPYVKDAIEYVKESDNLRDRFKILVGGGPVTQGWADKANADGYGDDAIQAVQRALALVGQGE
jgi:methanogenic corrinoid protein MtbC1